MNTSTKKLLFLDKSWPILVEFGQILANLRSNLLKFGHRSQIWHSNLSYESWKNQNSNEFERIRPSLVYTTHCIYKYTLSV